MFHLLFTCQHVFLYLNSGSLQEPDVVDKNLSAYCYAIHFAIRAILYRLRCQLRKDKTVGREKMDVVIDDLVKEIL